MFPPAELNTNIVSSRIMRLRTGRRFQVDEGTIREQNIVFNSVKRRNRIRQSEKEIDRTKQIWVGCTFPIFALPNYSLFLEMLGRNKY